jgi:hypothetical protein
LIRPPSSTNGKREIKEEEMAREKEEKEERMINPI